MDTTTLSTVQMLFTMFDFIFDFWPFLLLNAITGRRHLLRNMLITWGFWAIVRVFLFFNPEPLTTSFFLAEPLNTVLFFVTGVVLIGLQYGLKLWKRGELLHKAGKINTPKDLVEISPREFEEMVVELFLANGCEAKRTGSVGDHGVDVVAKNSKGEKLVIQCKRWRRYVGEPIIRDFYGVIQHEKADKGIVITSGKFSRPAQEWAKGKPIVLWDGEKFLQLWRQTQEKRTGAASTH